MFQALDLMLKAFVPTWSAKYCTPVCRTENGVAEPAAAAPRAKRQRVAATFRHRDVPLDKNCTLASVLFGAPQQRGRFWDAIESVLGGCTTAVPAVQRQDVDGALNGLCDGEQSAVVLAWTGLNGSTADLSSDSPQATTDEVESTKPIVAPG